MKKIKFKKGDILFRNKAPNNKDKVWICEYSGEDDGHSSRILFMCPQGGLAPGSASKYYTKLFNINKMTKKQSKILELLKSSDISTRKFGLGILGY